MHLHSSLPEVFLQPIGGILELVVQWALAPFHGHLATLNDVEPEKQRNDFVNFAQDKYVTMSWMTLLTSQGALRTVIRRCFQ